MNFKKVRGYNSRYLVTECGKVWNTKSKRFLSISKNSSGYEKVSLRYEGKGYCRLVHRLVAEAFCEGYSEELQVNHIDANRLNNHASNLEWVTASKNIADSIKRGTHNSVTKSNNKSVYQIDGKGNVIRVFNSLTEASIYTGESISSISRACIEKSKVYGKFNWGLLNAKGLR